MTSTAQLEANRGNAHRSTGPRTEAGKLRSSQNAVKHGFTGRLLVGLQHGPFADDPSDLGAFVHDLLAELGPQTAQERAEALHIAGLYVRRSRLVELEATALAHNTCVPMISPPGRGRSAEAAQEDVMRAGANALNSNLFDQLPRYEAHLSRELDRSVARYVRLQESRQRREQAIPGELLGQVSVPPAAVLRRFDHTCAVASGVR